MVDLGLGDHVVNFAAFLLRALVDPFAASAVNIVKRKTPVPGIK
ncbi:hypothetical protein BH11GEM1_BH11GEM1_04450 [soil metagenome]